VREEYAGEALAAFDAGAYLEQHRGTHLLPAQQREQFVAHGAPARREMGGLAERSLGMLDADDLKQLAQESERLSFLGPQLVTEAITQQQHLVLLGEPGSGKSTALRYLALTLAQAGLDESVDLTAQLEGWDALGEQGRLLPLFLPLLPFAKRVVQQADHPCNADDLWQYIRDDLEANGRYEGLSTAVHEELGQGRVLLLLDGLDEVAGEHSRRQVVRAVQAFAQQYPQCRIVVTCRVRAYEGAHNAEWQLPGWQTATLADWTLGQMQHFVQAWYAAAAASGGMSAEKRDDRTAALKRAIERRDDLKRLGVRPLLLTIMALVHYNDGQLPEERVGLYNRCVDLLLGQWELAKEDGSGYGRLTDYIGLPDTSIDTLRPLLQKAAATAHAASSADNPGSLGRLTLREMVMQTLHQKGHPNPYEGADKFLEYTDVRAGLLQASAAGEQYVFPHLTFQEYLAGLELVRGVQFIDRILELRTDDRWRVPIQLGIGHLVSENTLAGPYQLFNKLLKLKGRSDEQRQRDLLLIAELGEDVGWSRLTAGDELFEGLRDELAEALVPIVEGTTLPAKDRVQAGVYLGWLGDPRPGVCTLPPAMVRIEGGEFVIGSTPEVAEVAGKAYEQYYLDQGDKETAERARKWPEDEINDQPLILPTFEIARYPLTNAQWKLFIDDDGYNPDAPWWDEAGRAWLRRDDQATEGLASYQRRNYKQHPEWWRNNELGIARPNHPVVGISWYEAVAFCRWLTKHQTYNPDGYTYLLPSEAEWEYAARRATRRTYPWGNEEPDAEHANFDSVYNNTTAVGCFAPGVTPEGQIHDLAGNVWEWTRSEYRDYPYDPADGREDMNTPVDKTLVLRGGGWNDQSNDLRASYRLLLAPVARSGNIGCRLARRLPEA
jgi:formylglycine-generating enzyme required for sulfatase activity/energy-coupling factor transporter ATP-binding protein EcfA2